MFNIIPKTLISTRPRTIRGLVLSKNRLPPKEADLTLAAAWDRATPQQRIEFIRRAGPESVWSALTAAL